jgi:hypothetical protein
MKVHDLKQQIDANLDVLFQSGYDLGWNSVIEEIQQRADSEWNVNNKTTAVILLKLISQLNGEEWTNDD